MANDILLEMKNISKTFPGVKALDNVSLTVRRGTVHALMGENGAGKSTLMKCLFGIYSKDTGEILLEGSPVHFKTSKEALESGVAMVHQELNQALKRNVMDNMWLGRYPLVGPFTSEKKMYADTQKLFEKLGVSVNPRAVMSTLPVSQRQMVEIAKAVSYNAKVIVFDEPTSSLTEEEVAHLFRIINMLRDQGCGIIYISHKMPELFEICDRYYVLRDGCLVAEGKFEDTNEDGITELMIGRQLHDAEFENHVNHIRPEIAMEAQHLSGEGFDDISFQLHKGEVLAITGLQGSGRDELADALFGVIPCKGKLSFGGQTLESAKSIQFHMGHGMALVPRMRKERGIHDDLSILDNMSMAFLNTKWKKLLISGKAERERFARQQKALQIKAGNPADPITSLSGGNQQKVILGKWLETDAEVLLFDNPTQGIDVGTKFEIYHLILELAKQGKAIVVFSSEFPEIYKVADSCMVLYKGRVNAVMRREEMTEKNVMYYSTGANVEGAKNA